MKFKKGDNVVIIQGKDRGKTGKVLRTSPDKDTMVVEGINIVVRHIRPRQEGKKGEKVKKPMPIHVSNAKIVCPQCKKATRLGYSISGGRKNRLCKQCGKAI